MTQTMTRYEAEVFLSKIQTLTDHLPGPDTSKKVRTEWVHEVQELVNGESVRDTMRTGGIPQTFINKLENIAEISASDVAAALRQALPTEPPAAQLGQGATPETARTALHTVVLVVAAVAMVAGIVGLILL